MSAHSISDQVRYSEQWFRTWSDLQKEDFVQVLTQKLSSAATVTVNGMVNGFQSLDTSGRPPSLFACQVKLFSEWWDTWTEEDRGKLTSQLKENDSKFWASVEGELDGSRKTDIDDFFTVDASSVKVITTELPSEIEVEAQPNIVVNNGEGDTVGIISSSDTPDQENTEDSGKSVTNIEISGAEVDADVDGLGESTKTASLHNGSDS